MTVIKNEAKKYLDDDTTVSVRGAIEHRAAWFYLLLDEGRKRGLEWDDFARTAINRCGHFHGEKKIKDNCPEYENMTEFLKVFIGEEQAKVLELEIADAAEDHLCLDFHYCPLVTAWQKLGCSDEDIAHMCDIAIDGDRGIAEEVGFDLKISKKIAEGDNICRLEFSRKQKKD